MGLLERVAVRCEAATGADRELDRAIELALPACEDAKHLAFGVPMYSGSLDAAMSLVPAGLRLTFSEWDDETHLRPRGPWQAILTKAGSGSSFNDMLGYRCDHAATPALAVCASALRARIGLQSKLDG